jgi:hypothetical protein
MIGVASTNVFNASVRPFVPSALAGDRRNSEVRVRIRSEMEQKMRGTMGKPVLITKICQA